MAANDWLDALNQRMGAFDPGLNLNDRGAMGDLSSLNSSLGLGASHLLGASGTIDLPQWLVSRGNNPAQHHVAWTMFKVDEIKPFIRLDGLTFGHKRRRLGQPTPGATP